MIRQRLRPDWPQRVYQYDVRVAHEAVPVLLRHAALMADVWNQLCVAWGVHRASGAEGETKKAFWARWRMRADSLIASSGLCWADRAAVRERFDGAIRRGGPQPKSGALDRVCVLHRFTGGGLPITRLFGRSARLRLESPDARGRTVGSVEVLGEAVALRFTLHRAPPAGAWLKVAQLSGTQVTPTELTVRPDRPDRLYPPRWAWKLCLTVEEPPAVKISAGNSRVGALDLNWRRIGEGDEARIRVGVLVDEDGRVERLEYPPRFFERARALSELQSLRDQATGEARYRLRREWRLAGRRLLRARQWLWRNWAKRLCCAYGRLVIEDMDLSSMVTHEALQHAPRAVQAAAWSRVLVAPSELRLYLAEAARKCGTTIERVNPAYTTVTCHVCGGVTDNTGDLELTCPLGHRWDQDENAARNLLASQASPALAQI